MKNVQREFREYVIVIIRTIKTIDRGDLIRFKHSDFTMQIIQCVHDVTRRNRLSSKDKHENAGTKCRKHVQVSFARCKLERTENVLRFLRQANVSIRAIAAFRAAARTVPYASTHTLTRTRTHTQRREQCIFGLGSILCEEYGRMDLFTSVGFIWCALSMVVYARGENQCKHNTFKALSDWIVCCHFSEQ